MPTDTIREKILSQDYLDFIIPEYRTDDRLNFADREVCTLDIGLGYRMACVINRMAGSLSISISGYDSIPNCYALLDMDALNSAGISAIQNFPTLQLQGQGIMIGFIDTGIDYQNMVFRRSDGSTRIVGIWDQTIQSGTLPEGFYYGSEYTEEDINEALRSDDPLSVVPSMDDIGHGTYVASVAAGGENAARRFSGAAPRAEIAMVKLKEAKDYLKDFYAIRRDAGCYQETDIMQGLYYLHKLALNKEMPLVLCVSLGSNFGGHNGQSVLSKVLESYARYIDRCVVIGGGNEANQRHHYLGGLRQAGDTREVEVRVENGNTGFVAELWTRQPDIITAYLVSPSGERSPVISIRQGTRYQLNFPFENTTVDVEYRLFMPNNDSQLIFLKFANPAQGIWRIGVQSLNWQDGEFHIWLSMKEFLNGNVYFLESNPDYTLTEPATTAGAITVAYYNSGDNSVDINSGRGYTRTDIIKPDFTAPGIQVLGADRDGSFVRKSGSSVAAGITAGAAALLMEWYENQNYFDGAVTSQVAAILTLGADQGVFPQYPNREWGYGRINLFQSLDRLRKL